MYDLVADYQNKQFSVAYNEITNKSWSIMIFIDIYDATCEKLYITS